MFYISKRIDSNHFCVVDTSDNVEETYSADELKEIAKTIDINGVDTNEEKLFCFISLFNANRLFSFNTIWHSKAYI